jgi:hypothetical protein
MANPDAAFGFRPVANDGGVYNGQTQRCAFVATDATAAYIGSVVKMSAEAAYGTGGAQAVTVATLGNPAYGVVVGFEANPDNLSQQYRPASTNRYCRVARAENTLFEIQETANIGLAGVGFNASFSTGTGSAVTGYANTELDSSTIAATNSLDLQVVEGIDLPDNDLTASNARWIVKFNDPQGKPVRTGT